MKTLAVFFAILAVFCVYGFIASFEPGPRNVYFRIGYPIVGLVSLVARGCSGAAIGAIRSGRFVARKSNGAAHDVCRLNADLQNDTLNGWTVRGLGS